MSRASRAVTFSGVLVALALIPAVALPQATPSDRSGSPFIRTGAHLRLRGQGVHSAVFTGRFRAMSNDSIAVALDDDSEEIVPFAVADIARLEVQQDEKTRDVAAIVLGSLGAAGGLATAVLWCEHNQVACDADADKVQYNADSDSTYLGIPVLMVMGGALIGGLVAYVLAPPPHWELVVFPTRTSSNEGSRRTLLNVGLRYSLGGHRRR
jgi:hypothetical protein